MSWALPLLLVAAGASSTPARFAIVIGENEPVSDVNQPLKYADDDAIMAHDLLRTAGAQVRLLVRADDDSRTMFEERPPAQPPTLANVRAALASTFERIRAARRAGRMTELYFVYSGHGDVSGGEGFVALEDGKLDRTFLYEEILAKSPANRNHVIIDACRSYFLVFGKGPGGKRMPYELQLQTVRERFPTTGFILSTSSDQESHEWSKLRSGIFSHEVRSALRGGADANLDSSISYRELGAFIEIANAKIRNVHYRPNAVVVAPRDEDWRTSVVLSWTADAEKIDVPADAVLGHMYLEDAYGNRFADAHPAPGQNLRLYTPSQRPLFLRTMDGLREYVVAAVGSASLEADHAQVVNVAAKGAIHVAFETLFAEPFSSASVDGYDIELAALRPEAEPDRSALAVAQDSAPWVSGTAIAFSVGMTVAALAVRSGAPPQTEVDNANQRIGIFNGAAIVGYSVGATAALAWLLIELGVFGPTEAYAE